MSDLVAQPGDEGTPSESMLEIRAASFSGPVPPPSVLADYEKLLPGTADRLIQMAEEESKHRRQTERLIVESQVEDGRAERSERFIGQLCGLTIGVVAIIAGGLAAIFGETAGQISGGFIGAGGVAGLVSVFIFGRKPAPVENSNDDQPAATDA